MVALKFLTTASKVRAQNKFVTAVGCVAGPHTFQLGHVSPLTSQNFN